MSEHAETILTAEEGAALLGAPEEIRTTQPAAPVDAELSDEARAAAHFASDAKSHKLTVHREDGVFRHVEFTGLARPVPHRPGDLAVQPARGRLATARTTSNGSARHRGHVQLAARQPRRAGSGGRRS
jgi:hypothetical protein